MRQVRLHSALFKEASGNVDVVGKTLGEVTAADLVAAIQAGVFSLTDLDTDGPATPGEQDPSEIREVIMDEGEEE